MLSVVAELYPKPSRDSAWHHFHWADLVSSLVAVFVLCCPWVHRAKPTLMKIIQPNQSSPGKQSMRCQRPNGHIVGVSGKPTVSQLRAVPVHQACAGRGRASGLVSPEEIPVHSVAFCSGEEVGGGQEDHPSSELPKCTDTPGRVCPKGASHSHWVLWLLCSNWGVLTLQEFAASPTKEGSESNRIQGSAASPGQGNLCRCEICAPHRRKSAGAIAARLLCLPAHRRGEQSSCWEDRNVYQQTQNVWFEQLCSFSAFSVLTQGQMDRKGFS